jgi:hypothetical protein
MAVHDFPIRGAGFPTRRCRSELKKGLERAKELERSAIVRF